MYTALQTDFEEEDSVFFCLLFCVGFLFANFEADLDEF